MDDNAPALERIWRRLVGGRRSLQDPGVFHRVSLIALLAWVGLGADGLSSSSYGPEAMFIALGTHTYLAVVLAVASALTVLMAISLALTAGGITLGYLLVHASPEAGKTMNAVFAERFAGNWYLGGVAVGKGYVTLTLVAEALLLFVAAQAGFIDGPRVMANMAIDSWLPHRFSQLSDRLTMQNGVLLMGVTSLAALAYTRGEVGLLVDMYAINVFITFSLSQAAMCRYWCNRRAHAKWKRNISTHLLGLSLCLLILVVNVLEKFLLGGWVTILVTSCLIGLCFLIRRHYGAVRKHLQRLDAVLDAMPTQQEQPIPELQPTRPTAVLMVGGYSGLGVHSLLSIQRLFPGHFKNFIFLSVGVVDSATFINQREVEEVRSRTEDALKHYVDLAHRLGLPADARMSVGTEAVAEVEKLCVKVGGEFPRALFFAGKLVFQKEYWFQRVLHNESAHQIQRQLQFAGLNAMVLPVRVIEPGQ